MNSQKIISAWSKAFLLAEEGKSETENKKILRRLAGILKKKKKERFLQAILKKAEKIYSEEKRIELILARPQNSALTNKIREKLLEKFGQDKEVVEKIDEAIIGGFRAKTENLLIRSSVKDFLDQIKNKLNYG